jgi:transcriptional regulator with XRE-family HTH domain
MPVLGSRAHEALIAVLIMARESAGMTQREVIPRLPKWLGWTQSTLAKVETGRRVIAFEEVQALCEVYGTNVAAIELQADAYEAAMSHPVRVKPVKTGKPRRKR